MKKSEWKNRGRGRISRETDRLTGRYGRWRGKAKDLTTCRNPGYQNQSQ